MRGYLTNSHDVSEPAFTFGTLRLEPDGTLVRGGAAVHLPPKELAALRVLLERAGQIVTPAQLKVEVWPDVHVTADSISKCMSSLRARLEPEDCIQTIYKRGYRLKAEVHRDEIACDRSRARLAIVPFAAGPQVGEHLGPGIAEDTTARLAATGSAKVTVLARDSVFTLARQGKTAQQIGEDLHADLVLTGTLHALPLHFRLRVEMIRVADGTQIWAEDMLVGRDRMATLESELVERLTFRLGGGLSLSLAAAAEPPHELLKDSPGYELLLRGHFEWQSLERHRMQDGAQHLLQATESDPALVSARVELANASVTQEFFGFISPQVAADQVRRMAATVLDVQEDAPAMLPALAWISFHLDHDLPTALRLFSQAAHLPYDPCAARIRIMFALSRHRFEEATELLENALRLDPFAPWLHARLAWTCHLAGRAEESVRKIEQCLQLFPHHDGASFYGSAILAFNGQGARATALANALMQRSPHFDAATAACAYALACEGNRSEALNMLDHLQWLGRERFVLSSFTPAVCLALEDTEGALRELRAGEEARCPWFFQMLADPRLARLRGQQDFEAMRTSLEQMESTAAESVEYV